MVLTGSSLAQSQYGEIVNGGFENWTSTVLYESPDIWRNTNSDNFRGVAVVSKSTDAIDGTYSIKLETVAQPSDTIQPYIYHGKAGSQGPDGGFPYATSFTDVAVSYRTDLVSTDTLNLLVMKFLGGTMVTAELIPVTVGQNSTWERDTIAVTAGAQDSLFIGFVIGGVEQGIIHDGSWALLDKIEMLNSGVAVANVPNASFEDWTATSSEDPDNWYTLNSVLAGMQLNNANKTLDAYAGSYAIEMTTIQPQQGMGGDTISSYVSMGAIDFFNNSGQSPFTPLPYGAVPGNLSGAFKYTPSGVDTAGIWVDFRQGGSSIGGHYEMFLSQSTYQTFSSPLTFSGVPDSIVFVITSGRNPGSILKVDELAFSGGNVGIEESMDSDIMIYPNPASDFVTININGYFSYSIYNITGKLLIRKNDVAGKQTIAISDLTRGSYFIQITEGMETITKKLIVQ